MNRGKLTVLYRLVGGVPVGVYSFYAPVDVLDVYCYLQEICNNPKDLTLKPNAVTTEKTFLSGI